MNNSNWRRRWTICLLTSVTLLTSCNKNSDSNGAVMPTPQAYDGSSYEANTQLVSPVVQELSALMLESSKGRTYGNYVATGTLAAMFTQGSLSLETITTRYYGDRMMANDGYFVELGKASGGSFNPFGRSAEGGAYDIYLFDENGVEIAQLIEKGLYTAALYNYAMSLAGATLQSDNVDQMVYLYGAGPMLLNSINPQNAGYDRLMAGYVAQRDKGDGTGYYSQLRDAFIKLQTALRGGDRYASQRDEALTTIRQTWEKAAAATAIHDLQSVISTLNVSEPKETDRARALHWVSEAAGFLHGWRTLNTVYRKITDAQIDELMALLNIPVSGTATAYRFVTNTNTELPKLTQAILRLQTIYGFTNAELEDFKHDWATEQGR